MGGRQGKEVAPEINVEAPSRPGSEMSIMSIPMSPDSAVAGGVSLGSAATERSVRTARTARSARTGRSARTARTARTAKTARTDRSAKSSRSKRTGGVSALSRLTADGGERGDGTSTRASSARSVMSHKEEKPESKRPGSKRKGPVPVTIEFASFRFRPDCEYSETYHMFTTEEDFYFGYPPPHPPSKTKAHILSNVDFTEVDKRAKSVTQDKMRGPVSALVYFLTEPFKDDISRVRAIYMWLTMLNIDKIKFTLRQPKDGTVISYLWKIKKKKGNHAQFFSIMCSNAGLLSLVINGYVKGTSYAVGMRMVADLHNAEWNAVLVGKTWRFVDAHWGSIAIGSDDPKNVIHKTDENYFLTDPEEFIYSHYPEEERWQLIVPTKTLAEFEKKAYIKERFFELGMKVLSNPEWDLPSKEGEVEIQFAVDPERQKNLQFMCHVFIKEAELKEWHRILEVTEQPDFVHFSKPGILSIKIRFPEEGKYKIEIFGKDLKRKEKEYDFDWIAIYKGTVESLISRCYAFPRVGEAGWGPGPDLTEAGLIAETHESGIIKAEDGLAKLGFILDEFQNEEVSLSYKLGTIDDVFDDLPMEEEGFRQTSTGYMMDINAPPGNEYALAIYTKVPDRKGGFVDKNICNYLVDCMDKSESEEFRIKDIERVKKQLKEANNRRSIDNLQIAIDSVEAKQYEKNMLDEYEHARDLLGRLQNMRFLLHNVLSIDQKTLADIRSVNHPNASVVNCMKAALLLIGNYEEETKIWRNIALLLGKGGRESVRRRLNLFNVKKLPIDVCLGAKNLLAQSSIEECREVPGIPHFYYWAEGMIAEKERITDKNKLEKAKPKVKGGPGGGVSVFVTNVKNKMPFSMV